MKRKTFSRLAPWAVAVCFLALLAGCGGGGSATSGGMSQVTLHVGGAPTAGAAVSRAPGVAPRAVPSSVARIVFTVSGEGMETIVVSRDIAPGETEIVVTLNVPKGLGRTFLVEAFDANGSARYRSQETHDLLGDIETLTIAMSVVMPNAGLENWTLVSAPGEAPAVTGIAFGGGNFVAVNSSGGIASSPTGDVNSWLNRTPDTSYFYSLADVAYGNGLFVAVGPHHVTGMTAVINVPTVFIASQDNVDDWTLAVAGIGDTTDFEAVAYGNGAFVAVGFNGSVYFLDNLAQGWSAGTLPFAIEGSLTDVAYGNGTFVAVGGNGIFTSTDGGRTWTSRELFPGEGGSLEQVVYADGVFVGLIFDEVYFSTDGGVTWTPEDEPLPSLDTSFNLTTGGGVVVIVTSSGDILLPSGAMDDPATTWTPLPVDTVPGVPDTFGSGLRCGTAGNGRYIVGGSNYVLLLSDPL